ncbi:hypothetical protein N9B38_02860 [bacterium]|nr:hypothetical protein [bacterium]
MCLERFAFRRHAIVVIRGCNPREQFTVFAKDIVVPHRQNGIESQIGFLFQSPVTSETSLLEDRLDFGQIMIRVAFGTRCIQCKHAKDSKQHKAAAKQFL